MAWHKSKAEVLEEKEFVKTVGHRIALTRMKKGFSQYELARAASTSRNTISDYECGKTMPTSYTLYKLAETLEVSVDSLCESLLTQ
jgi:transcriptional regulator with XRE-family HTH domain